MSEREAESARGSSHRWGEFIDEFPLSFRECLVSTRLLGDIFEEDLRRQRERHPERQEESTLGSSALRGSARGDRSGGRRGQSLHQNSEFHL